MQVNWKLDQEVRKATDSQNILFIFARLLQEDFRETVRGK
jgi:hypothetical protein